MKLTSGLFFFDDMFILGGMKPLLIVQNCEIESAGTTLDYLRERQLPHTLVYSFTDQELPDPSGISAAIVMGCPESVYNFRDYPHLTKLYAFVAAVIRQNLPYLGICGGAQMLAKVLGAEVKPNPVKEIGSCQVHLTEKGKRDFLFNGFDDKFEVFQWHGDTFKVPFGAELLVEGADCTNQAFRKGNLVGLQFHLEAKLAEATVWCDRYAHELVEVGRTHEQVLAGYRPFADTARTLNFRLLDNFFQELLPKP